MHVYTERAECACGLLTYDIQHVHNIRVILILYDDLIGLILALFWLSAYYLLPAEASQHAFGGLVLLIRRIDEVLCFNILIHVEHGPYVLGILALALSLAAGSAVQLFWPCRRA